VSSEAKSVLQLENLPRAEVATDPKAVSAPRTRPRVAGTARDEFMRLAHQVFLAGRTVARTVIFCGAESGVGCSWVCSRTAEALVELTTSEICIVDANLRAPSLHTHFGIERSPGFADYFTQPGDARSFSKVVEDGRLSVLPAGTAGIEPRAIFQSSAFRARLTQLKAAFPYVLIDAGPGSLYLGAAQFAPTADGAILVVGTSSTRREEALRVTQTLQIVNMPILGAVLNQGSLP
jgi:Mrp family chromosome partitioning ATPase